MNQSTHTAPATPVSADSTSLVSTASVPPLNQKFQLGSVITDEQQHFLDVHGFLHFEGVLSMSEVQALRDEQDRITQLWLDSKRDSVYGIPLFWGKGLSGEPIIHRIPFSSEFSDVVKALVLDERFEPIKALVGDDVRVGHNEKDGVVMNRYVNVPGGVHPRLGWHTDGLRDLFYGRMPQQMLNFGIHLDRIAREDGGLRLIPGTHNQGFLKMCFYKPYFVWHRPDKAEIAVETQPGDVTIHDGRLWHRVQASQRQGAVRRVMFVPYQTGPVEPKGDESKTPFYHHLGKLLRRLKGGR